MAKHQRPGKIPKGSRWDTLWRDCLAELSKPSTADARLLERMILNLMHADAALEEAEKEPYIPGSRGGMVMHPAFTVAARCDERAVSIARQLRLTPLSRSSGNSSQDTPEDPLEKLDREAEADELAKRRRRAASSA